MCISVAYDTRCFFFGIAIAWSRNRPSASCVHHTNKPHAESSAACRCTRHCSWHGDKVSEACDKVAGSNVIEPSRRVVKGYTHGHNSSVLVHHCTPVSELVKAVLAM